MPLGLTSGYHLPIRSSLRRLYGIPRLHLLRVDFERSVGERSSAATAAVPHLMEVTFPIDAVYTWVDQTIPPGSPASALRWRRCPGSACPRPRQMISASWGTTSYATRCGRLNCTHRGSRHVYIVTDGQPPVVARGHRLDQHCRSPRHCSCGLCFADVQLPGNETNLHRMDL